MFFFLGQRTFCCSLGYLGLDENICHWSVMGEKKKGEAKWLTRTRGVTPHRFGWQQPLRVNPRCTQPPGAGGSCCSFRALPSSCPSEGHELEARFHRGWWSPDGISRSAWAGATVTAHWGMAASSMSELCAPSDPLPRLRLEKAAWPASGGGLPSWTRMGGP